MFEKVNPAHPDKVADRIAGAIVDLAYQKQDNPKVAVEVLIGHDRCNIIIESSCDFTNHEVQPIVDRIVGETVTLNLVVVQQDKHLAENQLNKIRCGDNGIFKGVRVTEEEKKLTAIAHSLYEEYLSDGKYILDDAGKKIIICQSGSQKNALANLFALFKILGYEVIVNPLGYWTGGINVDTGATNRKLGSDMAQSVTGGGLWGKDVSKADVSVNIYCFLKAQELGRTVEAYCAIGDEYVIVNGDRVPYQEIANVAKNYIDNLGGFEKFAEWGLVR